MKISIKLATIIFLIAVFSVLDLFIVRADDDVSDVKGDIKEIEKNIEKNQQKLDASKNVLNKTQSQVAITQNIIKKTETEIKRREEEIKVLGEKIELSKKLLESYLQEMYFGDRFDTISDFILSDSNLSDMNENSERLLDVKEKILVLISDIRDDQNKLAEHKEALSDKKEEHQEFVEEKRDEILAINSDIKKTEATLAELNAKLSKLKSELSSLLGKSVSFDDVVDAAKFASKATGVRKDFILGMLVVESDLGRYTGGCTADKSRMSKYRLDIFKDICEELDYNWKKQKVSCPPKSYKGTGGAMGVAQFMSDTWLGYKSSIASATGHNPPDPWNLTDGVVAMALKLAKGGATKKSGECNAAKLYLSGTTSKTYNWYCERVLYWAENYEKKLE